MLVQEHQTPKEETKVEPVEKAAEVKTEAEKPQTDLTTFFAAPSSGAVEESKDSTFESELKSDEDLVTAIASGSSDDIIISYVSKNPMCLASSLTKEDLSLAMVAAHRRTLLEKLINFAKENNKALKINKKSVKGESIFDLVKDKELVK